jgi:hypothetical protein
MNTTTNDAKIIGPCSRCDLGDIYARPDGSVPVACEECLAAEATAKA